MITGLLLVLWLCSLPGTLYLIFTLCGIARLPQPQPGTAFNGRLLLIMPAHDEASGIVATLQALCPIVQQDGRCDLLVIADNCQDDTAELARRQGVRVLERHDIARQGKGYALEYAMEQLAGECHDAYLILDADTRADEDLLRVMRQHLASGDEAIQCRYLVREEQLGPRQHLITLALAAFNCLRPRARARLGLSAGILGNGFCLTRATVQRVPYTASSIVEDLEYHLALIKAGIRVNYTDRTSVYGELPKGEQGSQNQRSRWEGGRLRMLREQAWPLLKATCHGQWRLLEPLFDLLLLPLGYQVWLLLLLFVIAFMTPQLGLITGYVAGALLILLLHLLLAIQVAQIPWQRLRALSQMPRYLLWKIGLLRRVLNHTRRHCAWVRTNRQG